jgi:hypothetical protein
VKKSSAPLHEITELRVTWERARQAANLNPTAENRTLAKAAWAALVVASPPMKKTGFASRAGNRQRAELLDQIASSRRRRAHTTMKTNAQLDAEIDDVLYAPGKHCPLSGSLCPKCLRYRHEHLLGNKTAAELGLSENQLRDQIASSRRLVQEIEAEGKATKKLPARRIRPGMLVLLKGEPQTVAWVAKIHWQHSRGQQGREIALEDGRSMRLHQAAMVEVIP